MEKMWFRRYGYLDWLEPKKYWEDGWNYLFAAFGYDEKLYDIVEKDGDYCYTNISI